MNKISVNIYKSLYDNVVAGDVLNVYRSINNFSIVSKDIVDLENNLMINSFFRTKSLFNSKYLYYKLSIILKDMGLFMTQEQIENNFIYLLYQSKKYINDSSVDDLSKIEYLNQIYSNDFYRTFINQLVTDEDIQRIHKGISLNNQAFNEIILLEKKVLIGSVKNKDLILSNKLAYYKLAMQIKGLGLKFNNEKQAEEVFNKLIMYTTSVLYIPNIDSYTKLNILDFLYFKFAQLNFNEKNLHHQFTILNNELKILLKNLSKNSEERKDEKHLTYSIVQTACLA